MHNGKDDDAEKDLTQDVEITHDIPLDENGNTTTTGEYYVNYKIIDSNGNVKEKIRTVIVQDTTPPVIEFRNQDRVQ